MEGGGLVAHGSTLAPPESSLMVVAATVRGMRAEGTFTVASFIPAEITPPPVQVSTALAVGVATMVKAYAGKVIGRSSTLFTSAFDLGTGIGTYVAMESFEGSLGGVSGAFNYVHCRVDARR